VTTKTKKQNNIWTWNTEKQTQKEHALVKTNIKLQNPGSVAFYTWSGQETRAAYSDNAETGHDGEKEVRNTALRYLHSFDGIKWVSISFSTLLRVL